MLAKDKVESQLERAEALYREGEFSKAEAALLKVARVKQLSNLERERIHDQLACLTYQQGRFSAAAFWYLKVVQNRSRRLLLHDPEMKDTIRNYRLLLMLAQPESDGSEKRLSA